VNVQYDFLPKGNDLTTLVQLSYVVGQDCTLRELPETPDCPVFQPLHFDTRTLPLNVFLVVLICRTRNGGKNIVRISKIIEQRQVNCFADKDPYVTKAQVHRSRVDKEHPDAAFQKAIPPQMGQEP
jgi:hypothetical protein